MVTVTGTGPTNGVYTVFASTDSLAMPPVWIPIATNTLNSAGIFQFTEPIPPDATTKSYRLRLP